VAEEGNPGRRKGGSAGRDDLSADPYVEQARPDPTQPPEPVRTLEGLLGDSDRSGYRRLYFSREFDNYAEFRDEDVVRREPIPADQPPFFGLDATRIHLRRDATVEYTRVQTPRPVDEFDLDVRLGAVGAAQRLAPQTWEAECPGPTWGDCPTFFTCVCGDTVQITICRGATCIDVNTCDTCARTCFTCETCETCDTQCGQPTCSPTCQTCLTRCNQQTCAPTCRTCPTRCNQPTCVTCRTCRTRCDQWTCDPTCNPHVFTCGGGWQCP
jgi:hypothetical protein